MRRLYTLLLYALLPGVLLRLAWRARREPAYLAHLLERFGHHPGAPDRPVIWIHAVSVGETRAAAPLIQALRRCHPDHSILLTHMTPTGRATGRQLYGDTVLQAYCPYDYPFAIRAFLRHVRPRLALIMETEVWPNLVAACRKAGVPVWLVNARLSERSARRYQRFGPLSRATFAALTGVAAQTEADAARLKALGAKHVVVTGNLKFDITPPAEAERHACALRQRLGGRPVLLAASTREGEEAQLLDALALCAVPDLLVVIVPRHPQRFDEVAALLARRGIPFQRRSEDAPLASHTRVLLGDSMGEMFAYYGAADVAIMGGSLLPHGGQNLIEACAMGTPVILGPHTFNFAQAAQDALAAGAALRVGDAGEAVRAACRLLGDPKRRAAMGQAGRQFAAAHRGATERTLAAIEASQGRG
ncbi:lipid IV(A) 3-deoxy-D-manno-octulosonic acid transferase [Thiobacter aerophilum]|uniref:3-deoxy-D-manno-octulosonic acid transferase n=1 Tax=Thiobacter aerophilum TaxID=3121275 RepID=A0ABV0ECQ8_9BURK